MLWDTMKSVNAPLLSVGAPASGRTSRSRDYTWLIVLVLGTVLLIATAILVAVFDKKGVPKFTKSPPGGAPAAGTPTKPVRHIDLADENLEYR